MTGSTESQRAQFLALSVGRGFREILATLLLEKDWHNCFVANNGGSSVGVLDRFRASAIVNAGRALSFDTAEGDLVSIVLTGVSGALDIPGMPPDTVKMSCRGLNYRVTTSGTAAHESAEEMMSGVILPRMARESVFLVEQEIHRFVRGCSIEALHVLAFKMNQARDASEYRLAPSLIATTVHSRIESLSGGRPVRSGQSRRNRGYSAVPNAFRPATKSAPKLINPEPIRPLIELD